MKRKIQATVITGFLGAGKTSLIRHLLERADGRRLALIINEFGDLGIDREMLMGCGVKGCAEDDIVELANGCICCTVADDFLPAMTRLIERPEPPEHILIEISGLALPKPLIKAFNWPEVRTRVTVDGVITVVDAAAVAAGRFADDPEAVAEQRRADPMLNHDNPLEELFADQLACADLVIVNKRDLLESSALARVESALREGLRPAVKMALATRCAVDSRIILGIAAGAEDDLANRPSRHYAMAEQDHDDFESFTLKLAPVNDAQALTERLRELTAAHDILRIKGFAEIRGKPMRLAVQGVGERFHHYFDRPWRSGEKRQGSLVVIGFKGLDRAAIADSVSAVKGI